jgi:argininosuccinate lyase
MGSSSNNTKRNPSLLELAVQAGLTGKDLEDAREADAALAAAGGDPFTYLSRDSGSVPRGRLVANLSDKLGHEALRHVADIFSGLSSLAELMDKRMEAGYIAAEILEDVGHALVEDGKKMREAVAAN